MKRAGKHRAVVAAMNFALGLSFLLLPAEQACAQERINSPEIDKKIDALIRQLDDGSFQVRENAEKSLREMGDQVLIQVTAATKSTSAEVRQRAARLLKDLRRDSIGLRHLEFSQRPSLVGAVTVVASPDGKFLYAAAWKSHAIHVFRPDPNAGLLEHVSTVVDAADLGGALCLRLSVDGKHAITTCIGSKTICLFSRDATTGALEKCHVIRSEPDRGMELKWPTDAVFSRDGKFAYVLDDRSSSVVVLEVTENQQLKWIEAYTGRDDCFAGGRSIVAHPDDKTLLIGSYKPGTLTVAGRDPKTGRLSVRQVIANEEGKVQGIAGAMGVCISRDGQFVYVCSGRFQGDSAISAFRMGDDGKLSLTQELINGKGKLVDFLGGNDILISPDGKSLYATGTVSRSLACFDRDPKTGSLSFLGTLNSAATGASASAEFGPCGLEFSPDGKFLYLALEDDGAISVFARTERQH